MKVLDIFIYNFFSFISFGAGLKSQSHRDFIFGIAASVP